MLRVPRHLVVVPFRKKNRKKNLKKSCRKPEEVGPTVEECAESRRMTKKCEAQLKKKRKKEKISLTPARVEKKLESTR